MSTEIKSKVELKSKGEVANLPTIKQALVKLSWKTRKDFDLMAFVTKKDGSHHGVFTSLLGGDQGNANAFPFMILSKDAGVGNTVENNGENVETLKITKIDDSVAQIDLVALNYDDAARKASSSFSQFDAKITLINDNGETFEAALNSQAQGVAAHIATIKSTPIGATIENKSLVTDIEGLIAAVPGARALIK